MSPALRAGTALVALAFLGGCQLVLDFSPLEDETPDASPPDASGPDAADLCATDDNNDSLETGTTLEQSGTLTGSICDMTDQDFYKVTVAADQDFNALLTFSVSGDDNLDLELYQATTPSGMLIVVAADGDGDEQISRTLADRNRLPAGNYALRVFERDMDSTQPIEYELSWGPSLPSANGER